MRTSLTSKIAIEIASAYAFFISNADTKEKLHTGLYVTQCELMDKKELPQHQTKLMECNTSFRNKDAYLVSTFGVNGSRKNTFENRQFFMTGEQLEDAGITAPNGDQKVVGNGSVVTDPICLDITTLEQDLGHWALVRPLTKRIVTKDDIGEMRVHTINSIMNIQRLSLMHQTVK